MQKALTIIWLLVLIAGCRSMVKDRAAKVKGVIQLDSTSMSIHELNNWIADSHIAWVTDIGANRSVIIHKGVLMDAFNILSGEKGVGIIPNAQGSSTTLGKFAISIVEYCPTYWKLGEVIKPCKKDNPLGRYGLWFSTHIDSSIHSSFTDHDKDYSLPADKRRLTKGSIQAREQDLENFIHLIFASPPFANHPLPKKIQQLKAENDHTNVSTLIDSPQNSSGRKTSETIKLISQLGDAVELDVKMLVVDSRSWAESSHKIAARQPLIRILTEENNTRRRLRLVRDCVVIKHVNLTSGPNSSTQLASLIPGDIILNAHYHPDTHNPQSFGTYVITDQNLPAWLPYNHHKPSMACSQYYWSRKSRGQLLRIHGKKQDCSTYELASLTEPKSPHETLASKPKAKKLDNSRAKITTTPLYKHMKCLAQGHDKAHCEEETGCTNPFIFHHRRPEICLGLFEFLFQHIGPTTEYATNVRSYCAPSP